MLLVCLLLFSLPGQEEKPLPELKSFLAEFRKTLHTNNHLLSQYTYMQKQTHVQLDSGGKPKKTEVKVYQVLRAPDPDDTYQRLLSKDGVSVPAKELEKQDRKHQEEVEDRERKRKRKSPAELEKMRAEEEREENEVIDDVFAMYDIRIIGRESVDGHPVIRLAFKARPGYKPKTRDGKIMQKIAGQAWVSEDDHELARIDAEVIDNISFGFGLLAKLNKGTRITGERHKFNEEVWLPSRIEILVNLRLFMLKGLNTREIIEYSDHKKFNVETILTFPDVEKPLQ